MNKKEQFEAQLSEKASELSLWKALLEHPGWAMFEEAVKEQRNTRLLVLGEPLQSFAQVPQQEFMKGEGSGLGLAMKFPEIRIEILKSEVSRLQTAVELEEHHESTEKVATTVSRGRVDNERDWHGGGNPFPATSSGNPERASE